MAKSWLIKYFLFSILLSPSAWADVKEACKAASKEAISTCNKGTSGTQAAGSAISAQGAAGQGIGAQQANQCQNQNGISNAKQNNANQFASDCDAAIAKADTACQTCQTTKDNDAQQHDQQGTQLDQSGGNGQPLHNMAKQDRADSAECKAEQGLADAKKANSALARQQAAADGQNAQTNAMCDGQSSTGMPQLPQMPQMPQKQNDNKNNQQPQTPSSSVTGTSCTGPEAAKNPACLGKTGGTNGTTGPSYGNTGPGASTSNPDAPTKDGRSPSGGEASVPGKNSPGLSSFPGGGGGPSGSGGLNLGSSGGGSSSPVDPHGEFKGPGDGSARGGMAGGGSGGGGSTGNAPPVLPDPKGTRSKRPLSVSGYTKNFKGEKIGVAADDIFDMISHRYKTIEASRKFME